MKRKTKFLAGGLRLLRAIVALWAGCVGAMALPGSATAGLSPQGGDIVSVIFYQKDGTQVAYAMDDHPHLTFRANNRFVMLQTDRETVAYQMAKLDKFVFSDDPAAVMPVSKAAGNIRCDAGTLLFAGFQKSTAITVRDISGRELMTTLTDADGSAALSLSSLPGGIYIVSAGRTTLKIKK